MNTVRINENPESMRCWEAAATDTGVWHKMTEGEADYCLNVLPPIYFVGGFAVSEPIGPDDNGHNLYLAVVRIRGDFYCRELTRRDMDAEAAKLHDTLSVSSKGSGAA